MPMKNSGQPAMPNTDAGMFSTGDFEQINKEPGSAWWGEKDANQALANLGGFTTEGGSGDAKKEVSVTLPTGPAPDRQPSKG